MTTIVVLCDPPHEGVLPDLVATTPLTTAETADLYAAMCADVFRAAEASAGDLLVNYRPCSRNDDSNPERELRTLAEEALDNPAKARYEEQVGSTFSARVGNTIIHLLDTEGETSVVVVKPTAPFLTRGDIDGVAMKLRRSDVILGPTTGGRVYAAGFAETMDFADSYAPPEIETLTDRALDAGLDVDFGPMCPVVEMREDLVGALALIDARRRAGRRVPEYTAEFPSESGLALTEEGGELGLSRPDTDRS